MNSINRRLNELSLMPNFWPILALDHGLTEYRNSIPLTLAESLLSNCKDTISAVVMTYGLAKFVSNFQIPPMIIQCFGAPAGHPKVKICNIDGVLRVGGKGIAVQIDFNLKGRELLKQIESVSSIVNEAHEKELPVLFMISNQNPSSITDLMQEIRYCVELGADLIKIKSSFSYFENNLSDVCNVLKFLPPILIAGGNPDDNIVGELSNWKKLGLSGYCVGRTIFASKDPVLTSRNLLNAWEK